jgi:hypothetical protein
MPWRSMSASSSASVTGGFFFGGMFAYKALGERHAIGDVVGVRDKSVVTRGYSVLDLLPSIGE